MVGVLNCFPECMLAETLIIFILIYFHHQIKETVLQSMNLIHIMARILMYISAN